MAAEYSNITIFVDESPNGMYNVSVLGYYSDDLDDESEPDDSFESEEHERKQDAIFSAEEMAKSFVDSGEAKAATVLDDGNDVFYYDGKKSKKKRAKRGSKNQRQCDKCGRLLDSEGYCRAGCETPSESKTRKNPRYTEDELRDMASKQRLFIGMGATGITFADRKTQEHGDYKRCAHLPYDTLELDLRSDCPKALADEIIAQAAIYHSMAGQQIEVSASGQKVTLGRKRRRST